MASGGDTVRFHVATPQVAMSDPTRRSLGLDHWPDGTIGFRSDQRSFTCLAANGSTGARLRARGGDGELRWTVEDRHIELSGRDGSADYSAGGPLLVAGDGTEIVVYHGELHHNGDHTAYWAFLGLAVGGPDGFADVGRIIEPGIAARDPVLRGNGVEVGSGAFVVNDGSVHVFFSDVRRGYGIVRLGVARAPLAEVVDRAGRGEATPFMKLCDGDFASPALGGAADDILTTGNHRLTWFDAAWWDDIGAFVLVFTKVIDPRGPGPRKWAVMLTTSTDAVTWTEPQTLIDDSDRELIYVSVRSDPRTRSTRGPLDLWWLSSDEPDFARWSDARLMRCAVTATGHRRPR